LKREARMAVIVLPHHRLRKAIKDTGIEVK
jgi:hypothetical protein